MQSNLFSGFLLVAVFALTTVLLNTSDSNLEQRVTDLENRVDVLEEKLSDESEPDATSTESESGYQNLENWRKLKTGMSYDDVREILGEPERIAGGNVAFWKYQNEGRVSFFLGKVDSWTEP